MPTPPAATLARLEGEQFIWLASARPDGRPHLVPLWFVWADGVIYLCVGSASVKARNIAARPAVALALESAGAPVVVEGEAALLPRPWPQRASAGFQQKYDWDILTDAEYDALVAITPRKWLMTQ